MTDTEYRNGYALEAVKKHSASKIAEATEVISQWLSSFQNNQANGLLCIRVLIEAVHRKSAWELAAGKADRINSESPENNLLVELASWFKEHLVRKAQTLTDSRANSVDQLLYLNSMECRAEVITWLEGLDANITARLKSGHSLE